MLDNPSLIAFYLAQIKLHKEIRNRILSDDPYRVQKLRSMDDRIQAFSEELKLLHPDSLRSWIV